MDSLTLTAVFVGSASAGFEFRHPIATRASVSGAGAVGNVGSRALESIAELPKQDVFYLYTFDDK